MDGSICLIALPLLFLIWICDLSVLTHHGFYTSSPLLDPPSFLSSPLSLSFYLPLFSFLSCVSGIPALPTTIQSRLSSDL
jgi:hypothetical protein